MVQFVSLLALIISLGILFVIHIQRVKDEQTRAVQRIWELWNDLQVIHLENITESRKVLDRISELNKSQTNVLSLIEKCSKQDIHQYSLITKLNDDFYGFKKDQAQFVRLLSEYRQQTLLLAEALGVEFVPEKTETFKPKFVKRKHG